MQPPAPAPTTDPPPGGPASPTVGSKPNNGGRRPLFIVLLLLSIGAVCGLWQYLANRPFESTDDAFVEAHVIEISPQVAAPVLSVHVLDNQEVKKGDLLIELDPRDFEVKVADAKANEATAKARLADATAQLAVADAAIGQTEAEAESARATAENAEADLKRNQTLDSKAVISKRELDNAVAAARTTRAALQAAEKKSVSSRAQRAAAEAQVQSAQAALREITVQIQQAELQNSYARIYAPAAGRIARKSVEPGSYVQPGQALLSVVPADYWVVANFKETQLRDMRPGQPVELRVDALGGRLLKGHVDSVQAGTGARFSALPPENATGNYVKIVQRIPVKIDFDEPAEVLSRLVPGLSVVPKVRVR